MLTNCRYCGVLLTEAEENLYGDVCTFHYEEYEYEDFPIMEREDDYQELNFDSE